MWDHTKLSKFNFTWWDATTFLPYIEETSFENSLMTQRTGALQLSSLKSVFQSLTTNAKGIFQIIIGYQLENQKQSHYQGKKSILICRFHYKIPLRPYRENARQRYIYIHIMYKRWRCRNLRVWMKRLMNGEKEWRSLKKGS